MERTFFILVAMKPTQLDLKPFHPRGRFPFVHHLLTLLTRIGRPIIHTSLLLALIAVTTLTAKSIGAQTRLTDEADRIAAINQSNLEQIFQNRLQSLMNVRTGLDSALADQAAELDAATAALLEEVSKEPNQQLAVINAIYDNLNAARAKAEEAEGMELDTTAYKDAVSAWKDALYARELGDIAREAEEQTKQLEEAIAAKKEEEAKRLAAEALKKLQAPVQAAAPAASGGSSGGSSGGNMVNTPVGSFRYTLVRAPIGTRVYTLTAADYDCTDDCPAKSLADYVSQVGGFAGIHGTYFCPPDYSFCNDQTNVFWSAMYNSALGKWIYWDKRGWNDRAGIGFSGTTPTFYPSGASMPASVSAGIVNYPGLLHNGQILVTDANTDAKQKTKATRAAFGFNQNELFLAVIYSASLSDTAYAMQALGATSALNLDGGGSTALYQNGRYLIGPGRALPNAIVLGH